MPVYHFGIIRTVDYFNGDDFALRHPQQRARKHSVVADGTGDLFGRQFDADGADPEGEIGLGLRRRLRAGHGQRLSVLRNSRRFILYRFYR